MNSINLTGRITKDPELKHSKDGGAYCYFTIAVDDGKDTEGNRRANFVDCIAYKTQAEFLSKYIKKGYMLAVTGSLHISDREDSEGNKIKRATVKAFNVENLTPKSTESKPATSESELPFEV